MSSETPQPDETHNRDVDGEERRRRFVVYAGDKEGRKGPGPGEAKQRDRRLAKERTNIHLLFRYSYILT